MLKWFLIGLIFALIFAGCSAVTTQGTSRVRINGCEIIVDDTLGRMPMSHGGPRAKAENGSGVECDLWTWR